MYFSVRIYSQPPSVSFSLQICKHWPGVSDWRLQERPSSKLWAGQKVCQPGRTWLHTLVQLQTYLLLKIIIILVFKENTLDLFHIFSVLFQSFCLSSVFTLIFQIIKCEQQNMRWNALTFSCAPGCGLSGRVSSRYQSWSGPVLQPGQDRVPSQHVPHSWWDQSCSDEGKISGFLPVSSFNTRCTTTSLCSEKNNQVFP